MSQAENVYDYLEANYSTVAVQNEQINEEMELLRMVEQGVPSGPLGLLGTVCEKAVRRGVPQSSNESETYRLTHLVFYATDFGRRAIDGVDIVAWEARLQELTDEHVGNIDLLGELLIAAHCLGIWNQWTEDVFTTVFTPAWLALDRTPEGFAQNYHAVTIGGILLKLRG